MTEQHQAFCKPRKSFIAQTFTSLQKQECPFSLHTEPSQRHCIRFLFTSHFYLPSMPKKIVNSGKSNSRKLRWIISLSSHCFHGLSHWSYKFASRCCSKNLTNVSSSKSLKPHVLLGEGLSPYIVLCFWALKTCSPPRDLAALQRVQPVAFKETSLGRRSLQELCSGSAGLLPFPWELLVNRAPASEAPGSKAGAVPVPAQIGGILLKFNCCKELSLTTLMQTVSDWLRPKNECRLIFSARSPMMTEQ